MGLPADSVVNLQGRCHGLTNRWIADASVFPGCPAVGPGLTVIANVLRGPPISRPPWPDWSA